MKLEYKSKNTLAATKSKAKLKEFGIDVDNDFQINLNPKNLLVLSIGILGELAAMEQRTVGIFESQDRNYFELKSQLVLVAQYFDALDHSHLDIEMASYLRIVGAASYYLADMPGSASVLAKPLESRNYNLTPNIVEGPLVWALKANKREKMAYSHYPEVNQVIIEFYAFLERRTDADSVVKACKKAQAFVYGIGDDRELFFCDVIIAIIRKRVRNASITCLPRFTGIPLERWNAVLQKDGFISEFWPAQKLLGEKEILSGRSGVIQMPTSAGKTKSTELIIRSSFLSGRSSLAVVIAPFRALCREICDSFSKAFDDENVTINELLDVPKIDDKDLEFIKFLLGDKFKDPNARKSIMVSTPEKLVYLLRHKPELAQKIGLLIFDEGHQFDNGLRGVTYELLVASLRKSVPTATQTILISAVIANAKSIGDWLYGENGTEIQGANCIPTVRSIAFASWQEADGQLNYLDSEEISEREFIVPGVISQINLGKVGREKNDRLFPDQEKPVSVPSYLGIKLCHQGSAAIFCGTKVIANSICDTIIKAYEHGLQMKSPLASSDPAEIAKIKALSSLHFGEAETITKSIGIGVLPHSRNVPNGLRVSIEWAMSEGKGCLVVCTSTLSQGVNLPIKYLIISGTNQSGEEIKKRDFHNLMGRAGRSGYHTEGSIIFSDTKLFHDRFTFKGKWKWKNVLNLLDTNDGDACVSSLKDLISPCPVISFEWDLLKFVEAPVLVRNAANLQFVEHSPELDTLNSYFENIENIILKVESYMLSYCKDNPQAVDVHTFGELAKDTLAYHLSDTDEREMIVVVFEKIAQNVLKVDKEKIAYYGKALLGISQLEKLEKWVQENSFQLALCQSQADLLEYCWKLIDEMIPSGLNKKIRPERSMPHIALEWIKGTSYADLLKIFSSYGAVSQAKVKQTKIKMNHVVDFCEGVLGYDSMLIIGALADIVEGDLGNEEISGLLRSLQESLKIGLGTDFEKWLYSKGFADREVCKVIAATYIANGVNWTVPNYKILQEQPHVINAILDGFPGYFSSFKVT